VRKLTPTEKGAIAEAKIYAAASPAPRLGMASALALQWRRSIALGL
jgi:hypothetical protein